MVRWHPAGAAGAALLAALLVSGMAGPNPAEAREKGKWWTPRQGGGGGRGRHVERITTRERGPRALTRQWRSYGGSRVYRDVVVVRGVNRGPRYRSWRTYCPPVYSYSRRIIRVRPVRFYVAAVIGGYGYRPYDDFDYGCNFCEARFIDYGGYHSHVGSCSHRPRGYRVECSDWESSAGWSDDKGWRDCEDEDDRDGGRCRVHGRQDDCDDQERGRCGVHDRQDDCDDRDGTRCRVHGGRHEDCDDRDHGYEDDDYDR